MSKESALSLASQNQPAPEVRVSPVSGNIPENVKEEANPAVENGGIVPQPLHSTELNQLAKKEAKLLAERDAFRREQEEFKTLRTRVQEVYDKAQAFETTRKADPLKALKELGFNEKEIIDFLSLEDASAQISPEERAQKAAQAEIQKFKDEAAKEKQDALQAKNQALVQEFKGQLTSVVSKNPEKYELCAYHGPVAEEIMFEIAVQEAKEGKAPDVASIANDVEEFYMQQFESMKKLKKLTPQQEAVLEASQQPERSRTVHPSQDIVKPRMTTLTNKVATTAASFAKPLNRVESREEKRSRLEAIIRNGLVK